MKKEPIIPLKERLISFETAILAKEKGFKNACDWFVNKDNEYIFMPDLLYPNKSEFSYKPEEDPEVIEWEEMMKTLALAPTQSFLQKWLREIHKLDVYVISEDNSTYWYNLHGENINPRDYRLKFGEDDLYNSTYEEALKIGLLAALKLIDP